MTNLDRLKTLGAYVPPSLVRLALSAGPPAPLAAARAQQSPAAVLFADVSGFTPLTERLAQKGPEGPEELTRLLNGYFARMIALIEAEGGEVVKFSGDALTVVFPAGAEPLGHAVRRALQAAQAMQTAMAEFESLATSVGRVALGMKIGLGAGELVEMWVGGDGVNRWEYVIAGDPLRQVAVAEHEAARGEIVLSPEAAAWLSPGPLAPRPLTPPDWSQVQDPAAAEAVLTDFIPPVVATWLRDDLGEWLAVLRKMSVVFVGIEGLDYAEPAAVERLHAFLRAAGGIAVERYEGALNKLAVDDKGTVLIGLFGAPPRAHEDDPERALRCALAWQDQANAWGLRLAIGVTTGHVFAGPVGGPTRREYTVMGDTVNVAARLMALAGPGRVVCDYETYRGARSRLSFDLLPPVYVKGKAGLIRIYRPLGDASRGGPVEAGRVLVGRRAELAEFEAILEAVAGGGSRVVVLEGEAGIGKSRLVEEGIRLMRERGLAGLIGAGRSIEQQTPYRAWRDIFSAYFDLEGVDDPAARQALVEARVRDVVPQLAERLPLLNDVLGLGFAETPLVAALDTQLRHESLVSLLLGLLRAWAAERPLVVALEDAHWLDSLSWDLTLQVARTLTVARAPILLVVVMRPLDKGVVRPEAQALAQLPEAQFLRLGALRPEETVALAAARLGLPPHGLPEAVAELVRTRADGNPFFAEELVYYLRDNGLIEVTAEAACRVVGDLRQAALALPDTIQGLILSRIDRLTPESQLALKVAAVIGRTFLYTTLHDTWSQQVETGGRLLRLNLETLAQLDLTPLEAPEPELTYVFKHIITQEVAYETLLFAQRRQLHRAVAVWYERRYDIAPEQLEAASEAQALLPVLAFHWRNAEDPDRERAYAAAAGKWSAAQFANEEAVTYLTRALALTPADEPAVRYDLLRTREAAYDLLGDRAAQAQDLTALAALAAALADDRRRAEVALRQADFAEATSDYPAALAAVQTAVALAAGAQDTAREAEAHIAWGKVLWRQGDYAAAGPPLEQALALARASQDKLAEARSLYYLGDVALYQNNLAVAEARSRQAADLYRGLGHRQGEADALSNLGIIYQELGEKLAARDHYERALTVFNTLGDRRGETIALSNLGTLFSDLGDFATARDYHERGLALRRMIGDRWGEAVSLVNLGLTDHLRGAEAAARESCERALAIQREIGDRRGQGYSLTYLGHALAGLGDLPAAAEAYEAARQLREALGQTGLSIDDRAGLAAVALAAGDPAEARAQVEAVLAWTGANGLTGLDYPLRVLATCHQVLAALGPPEAAQAVLAQAHAVLMAQADGLKDPALRRAFLEDFPANRAIVAAWARRSGG